MKIYDVQNTYTNDTELHWDLDKINKITEKKLEDLTLKDFNKLIALYERSSVSLRRILEMGHYEDDSSYYLKNNYKKLNKKYKKNNYYHLDNLPVEIEKKGDIYHITCAYTFKKPINESYYIADNLRAAVAKERQNGMEFEFKGKQLVIALRVDEENFKNPYKYKDSDNLETSEIINVMFAEACGIDDNINRMSFFTHFITSSDDRLKGFHLFILPYDNEEIRPEKLLKTFYQEDETEKEIKGE